MAELGRYIDSYLIISELYTSGLISSDELVKEMSSRAAQVISLYKRQLCSAHECEDTLARLFREIDQATKKTEIVRMQSIARELGAETLTTDTKGSRPAAWFKETGKSFMTGEPSNGFVCAIVNPDIGMGASHRNTVTIEDFSRRAQKLMRGQHMNSSAYTDLVSQDMLKKVTELTINEAFSEFKDLHGGNFPAAGTHIMISGISKIDPFIKEGLVISAVETVTKHPDLQSGIDDKSIYLREEIGRELGVTYGKDYQSPEFYSLNFTQSPNSVDIP